MSRTIDEKVVEMKFDNSDFEKNVSQSMSTLDKLKGALDFTGVGGAIDEVGHKFTALEAIATGALMKIGADIETKLVNTLKSVSIDQVTEGFNKYGEKTQSVQTIMNATGKEIDEVSAKLDKLNWFTDETSYNFTDMTSNIGKFTSQGVDLDRAVVAMEGISTAAALAGQNAGAASRVMYNFSQALGMGSVKLRDWMSVENANMATEEFKQTIIDTAIELGRLDEYGNIRATKYVIDDLGNIARDELGNIKEEAQDISKQYSGPMFANIKNFRETLAADWFDDKVLIAAMEKFGGYSMRLNEVYEQFNENGQVTTSEIIGFVNDFMAGTLDMSDAIEKTGLSAEEILPILEELSSEEYELGRRSFAAAQEAKTFEEAINATKDAVSTAWMNTFEIIFGNYEEAKVLWTDLANELWDIFAGPINDMNEMLTGWKEQGGRDSFIQSFKNIYGAIRSVVDPIKDAFATIFPAIDSERLLDLTKRFEKFTEKLRLSETDMIKIKGLFEGIFRVVDLVKDGIGGVISAFSGGLSRSKKGFFEGLIDTLYDAGKKLAYFADSIRKVKSKFEEYTSVFSSAISPENTKRIGQLREELNSIKETHPILYEIVDIFEKIKDSAYTIGGFIGRFFDIKDIANDFKDAGGGIAGVTEIISDRLTDALETVQTLIQTWTGINIGKVTGPIIDAIEWVQDKIKEIRDSGVIGEIKGKLIDIVDAFEARFGTFWSWFQPLADAGKSIWQDFVDGIKMLSGFDGNGVGGMFDKIKSGLDAIKQFVQDSPMLQGIIDTFKGIISDFGTFLSSFLSLKDTIELFRTSGGGIDGILSVIYDKIGDIFKLVSDIIYRITGLDISKILDVPAVNNFLEILKDVISLTAHFIEDFLSLGDISTVYKEAGGGFKGVLAVIHDKIYDIFTLIGGIIERVTGLDIPTLGGNAVKVVQAIEEGLAHIGNFIAKLFGWNDNPFEKFLGSSSGALDSFMKTLSSLGGEGGEGKSPIAGIFDSIGSAFSKLWDALKIIAPDLTKILQGVWGIIKDIFETFRKMSIDDILNIAKVVILIHIGLQLSDMFDELGDTLNRFQQSLKADAIKSIATAVLAVAGAAYLISQIESDKVLSVIGIMATALIGLIGLMVASRFSDPKALAAFAPSILSIAVSAWVLSKALDGVVTVIERLGEMDYEDLVDGLLGLSVAMGEMVAALVGVNRLTKGNGRIGKAFSSLAAALIMMFVAIELFRLVDFDTLLESLSKMIIGIAGIGLTISLLTAFNGILEKITDGTKVNRFGSAMKEIVATMILLSAAIAIVNLIPFEDFIVGLGKIIAGFLALSAVLDIVEPLTGAFDKFSESLKNLAKALFYITIVIGALGLIGTIFGELAEDVIKKGVELIDTLLQALAEKAPSIADSLVVIILGIIDAVSNHAGEIVGSIMHMVLSIFTEVGKALKDVDPEPFFGGAAFIAGIVAAMFGIKKMGGINFKTFISTGFTIIEAALIMTEIIAVLAGIGTGIQQAKNELGWDVKKGIEILNDVLDVIAESFFSKVGAMIIALGAIFIILDKIGIKGSFSSVKDTFLIVLEMMTAIGEIVLMMGTLGTIVSAANEGIKAMWGDNSEGKGFKEGINYLAEVLGAIADLLLSKAGAIILAISIIFTLMKELKLGKGAWGSGASAFSGITAAMVYIVGIVGIVIGLVGVLGQLVQGLDGLMGLYGGDLVEGIEYLGSVLTAIASILGNAIGSFIGSILGSSIGETLHTAATGYAKAIEAVVNVVSTIPDNLLDKADLAAKMLLTLMQAVPNEGGLLGYIFGDKDTGTKNLIDNLPKFGKAINEFVTNLGDIDSEKIEAASPGIEAIMKMAEGAPKEGGVLSFLVGKGTTFIKNLSEVLPDFADGMVLYSQHVGGIDEGKIAGSLPAVETFMKMAEGAPKEGGILSFLVGKGTNTIRNLGDVLPDFADGMVAYSNHIAGINKKGIEASAGATEVISSLIDGVTPEGGLLNWLTGKQSTAIKRIGKALPDFGDGIVKYSQKLVDFDKESADKAEGAAKLALSLAQGVTPEGGVLNWLNGKQSTAIKNIAESLPYLGSGLRDYSINLSGFDEEAANSAASSAELLTGLADTVPKAGGLLDIFIGNEYIGMKDLGLVLGGFGAGLTAYSQAMAEFDSEAVNSSKTGVESILDLSDDVSNEGGWHQGIFGSNAEGMELLTNNLKGFADAVVYYSKQMNNFDESAVEATEKGVSIITYLADKVPNSGGLWEKLAGSTYEGMDEITHHLNTFAGALVEYSATMNEGFNADAVEATKNAVLAIMYIANTIPTSGGIWEDLSGSSYAGMKNFAEYFPKVGEAMASFANSITAVTSATLWYAGNVKAVIDNIDSVQFKLMLLPTFGGYVAEYYNKIKDVNTGTMYGVVAAVEDTWNRVANMLMGTKGVNYIETFAAGQDSIKGYADGMKSGEKAVEDVTGAITKQSLLEMMNGLGENSPSKAMEQVGVYAIEGFAIGMDETADLALKSTEIIAQGILDTTRDVLGIHSPSEAFKQLAEFCTKGFKEGLFSGIPNVEGGISSLLTGILNGDTFATFTNKAKEFGIDFTGIFGDSFTEKMSSAFALPDVGGMVDEALGSVSESLNYGDNDPLSGVFNGTMTADEYVAQFMSEIKAEQGDILNTSAYIGDTLGEGVADTAPEGAKEYLGTWDDYLDQSANMNYAKGTTFGEEYALGALSTVPEGAEELKNEYQEHLDNTGALEITTAPTVSLDQAKSALEILDRYLDGLKASINEMRKSTNEFAEESIKNAEGVGTAATESAKKYGEAGDAVSDAAVGAEETADIIEDRVEDLANTEVEGPVITVVFDDKDAIDELEKFRERLKAKGYVEVNLVKEGDEIPQNGNVVYYGETESERREREQREAFAKSSKESAAALAQEEVLSPAEQFRRSHPWSTSAEIYNKEAVDRLTLLNENLNKIRENTQRSGNVYLDSGQLVGAVGNRLDADLGRRTQLAGRGV